MMEDMRTYPSGDAHLEVTVKEGHTSISEDGTGLDLLYCCAVAIVMISKDTGQPPLSGLLKVADLVAAIEAADITNAADEALTEGTQ